jgi:hypothetical protein
MDEAVNFSHGAKFIIRNQAVFPGVFLDFVLGKQGKGKRK